MDPNIIQEIVQFLSKWYIWELIIIVAAILLTLIVKIPIKRAAIKWEEKYGIDKSKITWINAIFPYIFVFIFVFILYWYKANWSLTLKDPDWWKAIGIRTATLGSGAIGLYELIKKVKQAIIAANQKAKLDKQAKEEAKVIEEDGQPRVVEIHPAIEAEEGSDKADKPNRRIKLR